MVEINHTQLVKLLVQQKGAAFAALHANTEPEFKAGFPYVGSVRKLTKANVLVNFIYENAVNNQRLREEKEADFVAEPRRWGSRIRLDDNGKVRYTPLVFIEDSYPHIFPLANVLKIPADRLYLEVKLQSRVSQYTLDNSPVTDAKTLKIIQYFMRKKSTEGRRQRLKTPVILRDFSLLSLRELHMSGEIYKIGE